MHTKASIGLALIIFSHCAQAKLAQIPIYLNFNSHNETSGLTETTNYGSATAWCTHRDIFKQIIDGIVSKGARYNSEHDAAFLAAMAAYDSTCSSAAGSNIIKYLVSKSPQIQIDPHSHEDYDDPLIAGTTKDNYADTAKRLTDLGANPRKLVGGFTYDTVTGSSTDWEVMQSALVGRQFPGSSYTFDYLWGAGSANHTADLNTYGFWKPKNKSEFTTHDESKRLIFIGNGCSAVVPATTSAAQVATNAATIVSVVKRIMNYAATRTSQNGEIYTQTIQMDHKNFSTDYVTTVLTILDQLQPYVDSGQIVWATHGEKVDFWKRSGARPFRVDCNSIPQ